MGLDFPVKWVREGKADLLAPAVTEIRRSSIPFYNPVTALNRDISLAVVMGMGKPRVADVMTGIGSRAIRYAIEGAYVEANDLSPSSLSLLLASARKNGISDRIGVQSTDARSFLSAESAPNNRFDFVDLDPFGSPAPFLDSALAAVKAGGLLAFTATDLATLCGHYPKALLEKYGCFGFRSEFCHEMAIRILIGYIYRRARLQNIFIEPVLSFYADHYVRIFVKVAMNRVVDPDLASGFVLYFPRNKKRAWGNDPKALIDKNQGGKFGGPLWIGRIASSSFIEKIRYTISQRRDAFQNYFRVNKLLSLLQGELDYPPFFYVVPTLLVGGNPRMSELIKILSDSGVRASLTHFDGQGIRFDPGDEEPSIFLARSLNPSHIT